MNVIVIIVSFFCRITLRPVTQIRIIEFKLDIPCSLLVSTQITLNHLHWCIIIFQIVIGAVGVPPQVFKA